MEHVVYLGARGLVLTVVDGQLRVSPPHLIDEEARDRILQHRDDIVAVLLNPDPWRERRQLYGRLYQGGAT